MTNHTINTLSLQYKRLPLIFIETNFRLYFWEHKFYYLQWRGARMGRMVGERTNNRISNICAFLWFLGVFSNHWLCTLTSNNRASFNFISWFLFRFISPQLIKFHPVLFYQFFHLVLMPTKSSALYLLLVRLS